MSLNSNLAYITTAFLLPAGILYLLYYIFPVMVTPPPPTNFSLVALRGRKKGKERKC